MIDSACGNQRVRGAFEGRCRGQRAVPGAAAAWRGEGQVTPAAPHGRKEGVRSDPRNDALRSRSVFTLGSRNVFKRSLNFKTA